MTNEELCDLPSCYETDTPQYVVEAIAKGYVYGCDCGECYRSVEAARMCKKCRQYLTEEDQDARVVRDNRIADPEMAIVWRAWNAPVPPYVQEPWSQPTLADVM